MVHSSLSSIVPLSGHECNNRHFAELCIVHDVQQKLVEDKTFAHFPLEYIGREKLNQTVHLIVLIFSLLLHTELLQSGINVQLVGLQLPQEGLSLYSDTHTPNINNHGLG